jgi:hypothetical protein
MVEMMGDQRRATAAAAAAGGLLGVDARSLHQTTLTQMYPPPLGIPAPAPAPAPTVVAASPTKATSTPKAAPAMPAGWRQIIDYENNRVFYVNDATGGLSRTVPSEMSVPSVTTPPPVPAMVYSAPPPTSIVTPDAVVTPDAAVSAAPSFPAATSLAFTDGTARQPVELDMSSSIDSSTMCSASGLRTQPSDSPEPERLGQNTPDDTSDLSIVSDADDSKNCKLQNLLE